MGLIGKPDPVSYCEICEKVFLGCINSADQVVGRFTEKNSFLARLFSGFI